MIAVEGGTDVAKKQASTGNRSGAKGGSSSRRRSGTGRDATGERRKRLLEATQGRRAEEVFLNQPSAREDMEAEAATGGRDAPVTPEMLEQIREYLDEQRLSLPAAPPAAEGARAVGPPPTTTELGPMVLEAIEEREVAGGRTAVDRDLAAEQPEEAGIEVRVAPRALFSTDQVVIVPGFLASALGDAVPDGHGLIWIDPLLYFREELSKLQLAPYDGRERDLDPRVRVGAVGSLPYLYDVLRLALEVRRYTVEVFPVDWRKDLEIAAGLLAARLRALASGSRRPIHLIAHSQGALVARRAVQLLGRREARWIVRHLILLGPANFGSFSAAFALAGNHSLLPVVRRFAKDPPRGFQPVLASMSGVYQLLPFDRDRTPWLADHDYGVPAFWKRPIDEDRLARFYGWARAIDSSFLDDVTAVILGDNSGSPTTGGVGYSGSTLVDVPDFNLPGDGTVTHSCSVLPGVRTYLAPGTEHSMLATYRSVIDAVRDLLVDRGVGLQQVSSDPADHLQPLVGQARGLAAPAARPRSSRGRSSGGKGGGAGSKP